MHQVNVSRPCFYCFKDAETLILIRTGPAKKWTRHSFICDDCKRLGSHKGLWKYAFDSHRQLAKGNTGKLVCDKCGHDKSHYNPSQKKCTFDTKIYFCGCRCLGE